MNVLLSIKPEYANAILSGNKRYELRRSIFKDESVQTLFMYASSPVKRIVGKFEISSIINKSPRELWDEVKDGSGVTSDLFFHYFDGCKKGYAIEVENPLAFKPPADPYILINDFRAPQSFCYLTNEQARVFLP